MKAFAIVGASVIGKAPFVETLIEAYRFDGYSVSCIKHAPDGFDIDQPGKASFIRRQAGAAEVMLVGDRRLVLMREYRKDPEPSLASLMARLAPVDLVIVEGFHKAALPTVEVYRPTSGRAPRFAENRNVVAVVSDEPLDLPLPCFALDDLGTLADFMARRIALVKSGTGIEARHPLSA